jgi:hypothetical protein
MTALIVALIFHHPAPLPLEVSFTGPTAIYATQEMCERQIRDTANRMKERYPAAAVRVACVPVVPGE